MIQSDVITDDATAELSRCVKYISWIKVLSSPSISRIKNADTYRVTLLRNFRHIGKLSRINSEALDTYYFPEICSEKPLSKESVDRIRIFSGMLVNAFSLESLDLPLFYHQSVRLLRDAELKQDEAAIIRALDDVVIAGYSMMDIRMRFSPVLESHYHYREQGIAAAKRLLACLEPSRFMRLPDDRSKETVLINARYIRVMYEGEDLKNDTETTHYVLQLMMQALSVADDPFYSEQLPSYDWRYHTFRTLEYISSLTDHNNARGCTPDQIHEINACTKRMLAMVDENKEYFDSFLSKESLELYRIRNSYLDGETDLEEYQSALLYLYESYDTTQSQLHLDLRALHTIYEYILTLDQNHPTPSQQMWLKKLYADLIIYMHRLPKTTSMPFLISYFSDILKSYREVPGGMSFESFGLNLMAAIHPPTYVHSLSVADFSVCIAMHLLKKRPDLFVGMPGYDSLADVIKNTEEILNFVYHAALCHDFGKLTVMDTIMTYGRRLFETDLEMIHVHPQMGAYLLNRFEKTRPYAEIALGHHRWYNNAGGYPETFDMEHSPCRTVISIIAFADSLDAATDAIGRSYKKGISLDEFLAEVIAGSGTRYAPYLTELLLDAQVRDDIEKMLSFSRAENYRDVWHILKKNDR